MRSVSAGLSNAFTPSTEQLPSVARALQLSPPPGCQTGSNRSLVGGFYCNLTAVGWGIYDSQLQSCSLVRFTCYSPGGGLSCYLFPNSTEAGKWTYRGYLTPKGAGALALGGCTKSTSCTIPYRPSDRLDAIYLQTREQGTGSSNVSIVAGMQC